MGSSVLQRSYLKSTNSLRNQLLLSFGTSSFAVLAVVVILACTSAYIAGGVVKDQADQLMRGQVTDSLLVASRLVGEQLDAYMAGVEGTVQLIVEAVNDRVVGYPYDGWEDDAYVAFVDSDTGRRKYPVRQPPPPMEWNITPNVNASNAEEHGQERGPWLQVLPGVTTASGVYFMQGACDPSETDTKSPTYYPNCTDANNDFTTGGVVQPTLTNKGLHSISGDLSIFLKALWESQHDTYIAGVYFHNSGAGSTVTYPGYHLLGDHPPYTSTGCEWMRRTNPFTGRPFATEAEIDRCHPMGSSVPYREFNPMEHPWCQQFALNPDVVGWYGPYHLFGRHGPLTLTVGKSVFDRRSGEFIGCVGVDVSVDAMNKHMSSSVFDEDSELMLFNYDTGAFVTDSFKSNPMVRLKSKEDLSEEKKAFTKFRGAVSFDDGNWTVKQAEEAFQSIQNIDRGLMTAYPIPVIPEEYDASYRPKFMVVHSISMKVFGVVESINDSIDEDVRNICLLSGGLALFGVVLVLSIVWCVSRMLTNPLLSMESVAWRIVNHADKRSGHTLAKEEEKLTTTIRCTPRTEVNQVVCEFQTMIKGFSGEGASKVAYSAYHEIWNDLTWHSDFQQLYSRQRRDSDKPDRSISVNSETDDSSNRTPDVPRGILQRAPKEGKAKKGAEEETQLVVPAPAKRNRSNVICTSTNTAQGGRETSSDAIRIHRSPLFWWIVVLIVIPLLLLICLICTMVSRDIVRHMPTWVEEAEDASYLLAIKSLNLTATSKASLMSTVIFEAVRDLHLVTRVAGWLHFGGIQQSASFTEMDSPNKNKCRLSPEGSCPFINSTHKPCDCEWNDLNLETCSIYNRTYARNLQKQFWGVQSQGADPETGLRMNSSSVFAVGDDPNTTWWLDASSLPGSEKGNQSAGYGTSYDRLRVSSAVGVAEFPVFNYAQSLDWKILKFGVYLSYEDDGLLTGVAGCRYYADFLDWESSEANHAASISPQLCPLGKRGYDPRCRDWYASGKESYFNSSAPIHFTASYKLAVKSGDRVPTSATTPIANPRTKEYVGQSLLLFYPEGVERGLERLGAYQRSILITPGVDNFGGDTVVGPNKSSEWESASIADLLFQYDSPGTQNRSMFERNFLAAMKNGSAGLENFWRSTQDGTPEHLFISFAPIYERALLPKSPDDFSRGVDVSHVLLYSVGMIQTSEEMHAPFEEIADELQSQLDRIQTVYIVMTTVVAALFTVFVCIITLYIAKPMITLLRAVKNINSRLVDDDFPPLSGGSREVHGVYNTFAKLFKVVRISNTAFFSGNLKWAYHFVSDALQLFLKVNDHKAVAIACNNLGNTLFAVYYDGIDDIGLDEPDGGSLITVALQHYEVAILHGERQFEEVPDSELKADFAMQLADRLFNRGLFLLLIQDDEEAPTDARQQAFEDIRRARNLDYDVKDFMLENRLLLKNSAEYFERLLRRINGLADFNDDEGLHEVWDVKELVDDADQLLLAAWNETSAPLFKDISRVGRLQQLETAAILLWQKMGNKAEAARLAMRMFCEDEYLLESSYVRAADALLGVLRGEVEGMSFSNETFSCAQDDLRRMVRFCKNVSLDIGKCIVFTCELCERWEGDPLLERINANCLSIYDRHCSPNDFLGVVSYSTQECLTVELARKEGNEGRQRSLLDITTSSTTERANPAFPLAIQMVVDSQASLDNDSYIVLMVDGYAWDSDACTTLRQQIDRLNRERNTSIHLFIIGLDMEDEYAREQCIQFSSVSKFSFYKDATLETIDGIFDTVATTIAGRPVNKGFLKGVTMERF